MAKKKGKPKIKTGRFYNVRDGSSKGHPGYVYNSDYQYGEYDSIITGTTRQKGMIPISPTNKTKEKSYLKKRPFKGTRSDYGDDELKGMAFDMDAYEKASKIKNKFYVFGYHYKNKYKKKNK